MRRIYMVTYDHKGASDKYSELFAALKAFPGWWHYIANSWLIAADEDAKSIFEKLKPHLDQDINLLIIEVGKDRQGWLPKKAWNWFKTNVDKHGLERPK